MAKLLGNARMTRRQLESRFEALSVRPFAHRGLHHEGGPVENSLAAFTAAIDAQMGIELDVQLTSENGCVVFHDATLDRLSDVQGPVVAHSMRSLSKIKLRGTDEHIQTLQDVLYHIGGRTPVLIEAKAGDNSPIALASAIRRALEGYTGPVGVMSFNPAVSRWFHDHYPTMLNGLVVSEEEDTVGAPWRGSGPARWLSVRHARAKFLAYDIRSLPSLIAKRFRRPGARLYTWTVRTEPQLVHAREWADQVIVEGGAAQSLKGA